MNADPSPARLLADAAQFLPRRGGRCVLLLHTMPDGSSHVDWLCESQSAAEQDSSANDPDARTLIAFRMPSPLDDLDAGQSMQIERMADHRRLYLEYEGPVSGDRGHVKRLRRGILQRFEASSTPRLEIHWDATTRRRAIDQTLKVEVHSASEMTVVRCERRANAAQ